LKVFPVDIFFCVNVVINGQFTGNAL